MVCASLIVPDNVPRDFLNLAAEERLITIVNQASPYALFDRARKCACGTRDDLAIKGRTVAAKKDKHQSLCYPCYALPEDCTFEESFTIVAWLMRNAMNCYYTAAHASAMHRSLHKNKWFQVQSTICCDFFVLKDDPAFMLRGMVVSPFGKGPALQSVIYPKPSS